MEVMFSLDIIKSLFKSECKNLIFYIFASDCGLISMAYCPTKYYIYHEIES